MNARSRVTVTSLVIVLSLFLQSITPALAAGAQPQAAASSAGAVPAYEVTAPAIRPGAAASAVQPLRPDPKLETAVPAAPYPQAAAPVTARTDRGQPGRLPGHLQPAAAPFLPIQAPAQRAVLASSAPAAPVKPAAAAGSGGATIAAALAAFAAWFTGAAATAPQDPPAAPSADKLPAALSTGEQAPPAALAAQPAVQSGGWAVGNTIGLNCGTLIRVGQGDNSPVTYTVEEDNYQVYIKDGPRYANGQTWWDIDRRAVSGNPNDGTGWMSQQQSEAASCEGGGGDPPINWAVGETIGLCVGTEIKHGPALAIHTVVPEDGWLVKVIGGPRSYNGQTWWDTSRREAGDPAGGTGWVSQEQTEAACDGNGNPDFFLGLAGLTPEERALFRNLGLDPRLLVNMVGDPVNAATGGLTYHVTDLRIPGVAGFDLLLERVYHSNDTRDGVFGAGWSSLLDTQLRIANDGTVDVRYPDGHGAFFMLDGDAYVPGQDGVFDRLTYDDGAKTFTLTTREQVTLLFTGKGRLTELRDRHGNTIRFTRDGDRITGIVDTGGRSFALAYDGGHVTAIADPAGRTLRYAYANGDLTAMTDGNGGVHRFAYADHRITRMVDPAGIAFLQNVYDGAGRIVEQIDAAGARATFAYDDGARRTTYTDNLGNKTVYTYDELKRITSIVDALGQTERYVYDADYNVTSRTDKRGLVYTYTYDERGNQLTATDPLGGVRRFTYNDANDVTGFTDELGRAAAYQYDGAGNLVRTVQPDGSTVQAAYDGRGQMTAQADGRGSTTTYTYDAAGNLLQVTNALQETTTYTYDGVGRQTSVTDANGHTTQFAYDNNDNLVRVVDAKNGAATYRYDANNSLVEILDRRGGVTQFGYDVNLKLVTEADPEGHVTRHAYDAMYNRISTTDARDLVTLYRYDALYRLIEVEDPLGGVARLVYDANGNVIAAEDALGRTTRFAYDELNRLVKEVDPLGGATTAAYDAAGQMTRYTTPRPATTTYAYDSMGRIVLRTDAAGGEWRSAYDAAGNLTGESDANGHAVTYGYDAANRLISRTDAGGHTTTFANDGAGNQVAVTDARGQVTRYTYDENNNLATITDALGGVTGLAYDAEDTLVALTDPAGHTTGFAFDLDGQLVRAVDGNGAATAYTYDGAHNRTGMTDANGGAWAFAYDELNRLVERTDPLGQIERYAYDAGSQRLRTVAAGGVVTRSDYDALGRVVAEVRNERPGQPAGPAVNVITRTVYDAVGNRTEQIDANGNRTLSTYDLLDRLVRAEDAEGQVKEYAYDPAGNLLSIKNPRGYVTQFTYDPDNLLVKAVDALGQAVNLGYDANHNRTAITDPHGVVTLNEFDALDRLAATVRNYRPGSAADSQTNVSVRYTYNPDSTPLTVVDANGNTTTYIHDAGHRLLAAQDALGGVTRYEYDPLGNLLAAVDANGHATGYSYDLLNRLLATVDAEGHTQRQAYDAAGNVVLLTNARSYTTRMAYDALGRPVAVTDAAGGVTASAYDAAGNLLRYADQNGHARTFTYDLVYRPLSATDAAGYVTAWQYDANGNRTASVDGNGHRTTYSYDALDRLASTTNAEGETTAYRYDGLDNVTHLVEADGVVTRYVYDPLYRLAAVVLNEQAAAQPGPSTNVRYSYGYDANGNLRTLSDPLNHTTRFTYDALDRLAGEVNSLGDTWAYSYDAAGNLASRRDGNGALTAYAYYADDQLRQVLYPDGSSVLHEYDANHNQVKMTDSLGASAWSYDPLDRLVTAQDALGRTLGYAYDPVGNRTQVTYPDGRTVSLAYFANDWLQSVADPDGGVTSYVRDGVGQPVTVTNPNATVSSLLYDKADRLLALANRQTTGARKMLSAFRYTLDDVGQRTQMDAEYGWRQPAQVSTTYAYDPLRRLVRTQDSAGVWTEYGFDAAGNRLALRTNDKALSPRPFDAQTITYSYNDANQLLGTLSDTRYSSGPKQGRTDKVAQALAAFQHEVSAQAGKHIQRAAADNLLAKASALLGSLYASKPPSAAATATALAELQTLVQAARQGGALDSDGVQSSLLAKLERAVSANSAPANGGDLQATAFRYDGNGNRVEKQWSGPQGPSVQGVSYSYSYENLLLRAQEYQGGPGMAGANLLALGAAGDYAVFLPAVTTFSAGAGSANGPAAAAPAAEPAAEMAASAGRVDRAVTTMSYDGLGRRLVKQYDPKPGAGGVKRTEYAFDLLAPVAEWSLWNGQYSNFYRGEGSGLVSMQTFPSGQKYWYQQDGLGSTAGLSKDAGQSVHNYRYDIYGAVVPVSGNWTEPHNHYTFTGQEWDDETKLLHFYARDYDPAAGVWLQQDPYRGRLAEPVTAHRYGYVAANPVNYVDPLGYERIRGNELLCKTQSVLMCMKPKFQVGCGYNMSCAGAQQSGNGSPWGNAWWQYLTDPTGFLTDTLDAAMTESYRAYWTLYPAFSKNMVNVTRTIPRLTEYVRTRPGVRGTATTALKYVDDVDLEVSRWIPKLSKIKSPSLASLSTPFVAIGLAGDVYTQAKEDVDRTDLDSNQWWARQSLNLGVNSGIAATSMYVGGVVGTAIPIPVVGTVAGAGIGLIVGVGLSVAWDAVGKDWSFRQLGIQ